MFWMWCGTCFQQKDAKEIRNNQEPEDLPASSAKMHWNYKPLTMSTTLQVMIASLALTHCHTCRPGPVPHTHLTAPSIEEFLCFFFTQQPVTLSQSFPIGEVQNMWRRGKLEETHGTLWRRVATANMGFLGTINGGISQPSLACPFFSSQFKPSPNL